MSGGRPWTAQLVKVHRNLLPKPTNSLPTIAYSGPPHHSQTGHHPQPPQTSLPAASTLATLPEHGLRQVAILKWHSQVLAGLSTLSFLHHCNGFPSTLPLIPSSIPSQSFSSFMQTRLCLMTLNPYGIEVKFYNQWVIIIIKLFVNSNVQPRLTDNVMSVWCQKTGAYPDPSIKHLFRAALGSIDNVVSNQSLLTLLALICYAALATKK